MKKIELDSKQLAQLVVSNRDKIGSVDWDIYFDDNGKFDIRHNTYNHQGWYFFTSMDSWWENDGEFDDALDTYGAWLESDGILLHEIEDLINDAMFDEKHVELAWTSTKTKEA